MERFFRKYGWVVSVALTVVVAMLLALAANGLVGMVLAPYTVPQLPKWTPTKAKQTLDPVAQEVDQAKVIEDRCLFGCAEEETTLAENAGCPEGGCPEGQECVENVCVIQAEAALDPSALPVLSDLNLTLTGVMVAPRQPEWSSAMVLDPGTQHTDIVRPGEMLLGEAEVVEIQRDRIVFKRGGRLEFVRLQDSIAGDPSAGGGVRLKPVSYQPPPAPGSPEPAAPGPQNLPPGAEAAQDAPPPPPKKASGPITRVSPGVYEVDGKAIDAQLKDRAALTKSVRPIPYFKGGQKAGVKLTQLAPGSVWTSLGVQEGDVLTAINGTKVTTQTQALDLFKSMKTSKNFNIQVERRGQPQTFKYTVNR